MGQPFLLHVFAGGCAERAEQGPRKRIALELPLRMPLHGKRKAAGMSDPKCFNEPIGGPCFNRQVRSEAINALAVERVDRDACFPARKPLQHAVWLESDVVRG